MLLNSKSRLIMCIIVVCFHFLMHIHSALDTTNKIVDKTKSNKNHRHHRQLSQHGKWESSVFEEKLKSRYRNGAALLYIYTSKFIT